MAVQKHGWLHMQLQTLTLPCPETSWEKSPAGLSSETSLCVPSPHNQVIFAIESSWNYYNETQGHPCSNHTLLIKDPYATFVTWSSCFPTTHTHFHSSDMCPSCSTFCSNPFNLSPSVLSCKVPHFSPSPSAPWQALAIPWTLAWEFILHWNDHIDWRKQKGTSRDGVSGRYNLSS
jgi:hypothetical protein